MMIEEVEMNAGDLVIATDASFEGDMALSRWDPWFSQAGRARQHLLRPTSSSVLDALWLPDLGAPRRRGSRKFCKKIILSL